MSPRSTSRRVVAFNTVGVAGFVLQIGALWLLVNALHVPAVGATALAVETAIVHNFICHWCWTWSDRVSGCRGWLARFAKFNATNGAVSLVVNVAMMAWLQGMLHAHYLVASLVGVVCSAVANFVIGDRVVFR